VLENRDILEQAEDHPYPQIFIDHYGASKAQVEQMVINEHPGGSVIRPPWTWGAGDTNNLPTLIKPHRKGHMMFFGDGGNLLECVHVANFVHAAILVAQCEGCRQQIFFVSDDQPLPSKTLINDQLVACGFEPATRHLPKLLARLMLLSDRLAAPVGGKSSVIYTFRSQTFSDDKLRQATGYGAVVDRAEGLRELAEWVQFVGGPGVIISGRRRGEARELVDRTWAFLLERSVSVERLAGLTRASQ
jgi:nucleoside-diphosphate-sugar epimerase